MENSDFCLPHMDRVASLDIYFCITVSGQVREVESPQMNLENFYTSQFPIWSDLGAYTAMLVSFLITVTKTPEKIKML